MTRKRVPGGRCGDGAGQFQVFQTSALAAVTAVRWCSVLRSLIYREMSTEEMLCMQSQNGSLTSSSASAAVGGSSTSTKQTPAAAVDTPVFSWDAAAGRRRLDLVLDVPQPYTADDVVVKLDGPRRLVVEATHVDRYEGRSSKTSMQRDFDLSEDVDVSTIRALLQTDGRLAVTALV